MANRTVRLVPDIIDGAASETPDREVFQVPRSADPSDGWKTVTFNNLAKAINRCCHMIIENCGKAPKGQFPTIAYIGPNDARYVVIMVAAVKTGYKFLAFPDSQRALVEPWLEQTAMKPLHIGSIEDCFSTGEVLHYAYNKSFEQAEWDPFVVLHTSGSTGLPKPVIYRQGAIAIGDAYYLLPDWEDYKPWLRAWAEKAKRIFSPMPLFHAAGTLMFTIMAIYYNTPVAFGIPEKQLSSDIVVICLQNLDVGAALLRPSILEDISQDENSIKLLAKLEFVSYGGGPLTQGSGDRLTREGVTSQNAIAATETAPFPLYWNPRRELWSYFIFNNEQLGGEWRRLEGDDEVYEQVIVRKAGYPGLQACFYTFPELDEYSTKDLFMPHRDLANHWRHVGRSDNIIAFSNGEKLNPVSIEKTLEDDPRVKAALVVGSGRFQSAMIIEPVTHALDSQEAKQFLENIWPLVVIANEATVAHGRIDRHLITLSDPFKPFLRAGKGTVLRAATIKLYENEIVRLYENAEQKIYSETRILDISSEDALVNSIRILLANLVGSPLLDPDTDYFSAGIDSLQIMKASRLLQASLEAIGFGQNAIMVDHRTINSHPTPRRLAQFILQKIVRGENPSTMEDEVRGQRQMMLQLYKKFTVNLQLAKTSRPDAANEDQTVMLTGSTGMLGSYMLDSLARSPRVKRIICLNRADDGGMKQQAKSARDRDLDGTYGGKAEFHQVDTSLLNLGLSESLYTRLLMETDRIIHNAWPVNFHMPVESFEKYIHGVRNIGDFAATASKRVAVIFISSVATVIGWDSSRGLVPEDRLDDMSLAGGGYGQSKLVSSLILDDVSRAGDFPAASVRVGQIAGPDAGKGVWNRHEWFPSIIASSLYLKALPADLGTMVIDWSPVERISRLVLEVSGISQEVLPRTICGYYHGVNPSTTDWGTLAQALREFYGKERLPEMVPFHEWVNRLESTPAVDGNPGIKLLDTYRGMLAARSSTGCRGSTLCLERTLNQSPTLRESKAITPTLLKKWCYDWNF